MENVELRSVDELVRFVLTRDGEGICLPGVTRQHTTIYRDDVRFSIIPGVIDKLIKSKWVVDEVVRGRYVFDPKRSQEWRKLDDARTDKAHAQLLAKFGNRTFKCQGYEIMRNACSMENDTRGYVFSDAAGDRFIVCEGGRVSALLRTIANSRDH